MNPWPTKKLGEVCDIYQPKTITSEQIKKEGLYKVFGANGVIGYYDKYNHEDSEVLVTCRGATCGTINLSEPKSWVTGNAMVVHPKVNDLSKMFLYYALKNSDLKFTVTGAAQPQITRTSLYPFRIPFSSLHIQRQIVKRLDAIKRAQDLNDKQIALAEELFQSLLNRELNTKDRNWAEQKLGEVCDVRDGTHESPKFHPAGIPLVTSKNLVGEGIDFENINYISSEDHGEIDKRSKVDNGDILFGMIGTIGNPITVKKDREFSIKNVGLIKFTKSSPINHFAYYSLLGNFIQKQIKIFSRGGTQKFVSLGNLRNLKILVPNKIIQQKIVEKLQAAQDYKKKLLKQKQKLQELFSSCLDKAMKGELAN